MIERTQPSGIFDRFLYALRNIRSKSFGQYSYSQEGEDMVLMRIFEGKKKGFYVDVGAHHPRRFSNTYHFYRQGWTGINIEPNPDAIRLFAYERPNDCNIQCGVAEANSTIKYYLFNESALNTFDNSVVKSRLENTPYKLIGTSDVRVARLDDLLAQHLPDNQLIDFLSIDVEGFDLSVLKSNNWLKYRPTCVLVEELNMTLEQALCGEIAAFMKSNNYIIFARTYNTLIFMDKASAGF